MNEEEVMGKIATVAKTIASSILAGEGWCRQPVHLYIDRL